MKFSPESSLSQCNESNTIRLAAKKSLIIYVTIYINLLTFRFSRLKRKLDKFHTYFIEPLFLKKNVFKMYVKV